MKKPNVEGDKDEVEIAGTSKFSSEFLSRAMQSEFGKQESSKYMQRNREIEDSYTFAITYAAKLEEQARKELASFPVDGTREPLAVMKLRELWKEGLQEADSKRKSALATLEHDRKWSLALYQNGINTIAEQFEIAQKTD